MNTKGLIYAIACAISCLSACGPKSSGGGGGGRKKSDVEKTFEKSANENKIPVRLMMAAAFVESNMSPIRESAPYNDDNLKFLGTTLTETAFGLTRKELGLTKSDDDLKIQIDAYAKWVRAKVDELSSGLCKNFGLTGLEAARNPNRHMATSDKKEFSRLIMDIKEQILYLRELGIDNLEAELPDFKLHSPQNALVSAKAESAHSLPDETLSATLKKKESEKKQKPKDIRQTRKRLPSCNSYLEYFFG